MSTADLRAAWRRLTVRLESGSVVDDQRDFASETVSVTCRGFPWWRVAVLAVALGVAAVVLWKSGTDALQQWLAVTGVSVAALVSWAAKGVIDWRRGDDTAARSRLEQGAASLATAVRRTWSREAANRGLTLPLPIDVKMKSADARIAAHPAQWSAGTGMEPAAAIPAMAADELTGTAARIADLYARVATRRLVIVGEPGAGKSGAAVLLMLALFDAPQAITGRIPVLFRLASWNPADRSAEQWMADQLTATYGTPAIVARDLVEDSRILPMLDGLDEIGEAHRPIAMARLRALGNSPLVLTCRLDEYAETVADQVLDGAAVVEVVPVAPVTAASYLIRSSSADSTRWDAVAEALVAPADNPCQQALRSPLMLSLARTLYRASASDPGELTRFATVSQVEDRLLDGLIPAVYGRDLPDTSPEEAYRWLSFLAQRLPALGPGAIAWWRLPLCLSRRTRGIVAGLAYLLAAWLWMTIFSLLLVPYWTALEAFVVSLGVGVAVGVVGLFAGMSVPHPAQSRRPRRRDVARGFKAGLRAGVVVGPAMGLVVGLATGLLDAMNYGLAAGLTDSLDVMLGVAGLSGLMAVIVFGLTTAFSAQPEDAVTPISAFKDDAKAGLVIGGTIGLVVALIVSVGLAGLLTLSWLAEGVSVGDALYFYVAESHLLPLYGAMVAGIGLTAALASATWLALRKSAIVWYGLSVALLARRGRVPTRPLRFLEGAYERGVVRHVGMVYEFRHARLAERLISGSRRGDE